MGAAKSITPRTDADDGLSQGINQPAAQTAHDLANFLTGIRMLVQSLAHIVPDQPVVQQHITSLQRTALHSSELCDLLQKALTGDNDELELDVCEIDIGAVVSAMRRLLEVMVRSDARFNLEATAGLPPILANPTQLRQVVLDLVTNASDALESKAGAVRIRTGLLTCNERPDVVHIAKAHGIDADSCVFLEVADTGCGIAEDELQRIFQPTYTTKKDGKGLGLASVLQIVRGCGGTVTVDSRLGEGTQVCCLFPATTLEPLKQVDAEAPVGPIVESSGSRATTILLIEDNEAARWGSKLLLERSDQGDFRVLCAASGREAMHLLRQRMKEISFVVLDVNLPDCQGPDLLRQIRQLASELPVLIVSGLPKEQLIAKCDGAKPNGFLVKPFDGDALIQEINSILRSHRRLRATG